VFRSLVCRLWRCFLGKISLSIRLDSDLVKRLDSRKTKTKNRSDVIAELLYSAVERSSSNPQDQIKDQATQIKSHTDLLAKGARAAIMSLRILELATEQHSEHADAIFEKAHDLYRNDEKNPTAQAKAELDDAYN